ncbi:NAD(P)-binding protein [Gonapodya prolifera JEL478]|uniref:NAD(P)-binding protein n=1 Tax=Gonapodya prolifera (strain JEL478) TaxID=1344416 RepID=A0A139AHZ8_GONPJ|nr:NAD(P)-binding protein [Gonapodya prolifera JEL478]|eukprot:KXS16033.1 NAD(P)-binding protein [Gonapodya prolifera JEL478]
MSNFIKQVALVGGGGNAGSHIARALLQTGKHSVTAISRSSSSSSSSTIPPGIPTVRVNYGDPESLVSALRGYDALVITLGVMAPPGTQESLIRAAVQAGVPWILPNEWAADTYDAGLQRDVVPYKQKAEFRKFIEDLPGGGAVSYVAVHTGFWYEFSLPIPDAFGFDLTTRTATLFDDGTAKISTSTLPQVGRAVAALLSLPVTHPDPAVATLDRFRNKPVYVSSFTVSQSDMLDSLCRVTGTLKADWTVRHESSANRYSAGVEAIQRGDWSGMVKMMYARNFFRDGAGDYERTRGTANGVLGLESEDLDEATTMAVERGKY